MRRPCACPCLSRLAHRILFDVLTTSPLQYKLSSTMLEPKSQPTYFADLIREIDEAPKRTWLERLGKRLSGMIRLE